MFDFVGQRVEAQLAGEGVGDDDLRARDERGGLGIAVVSLGEVAVERGDDGVGGAIGDVVAFPLTDARTAGVGEDSGAELLEGSHLAVALDGRLDLLRPRGDPERALDGRAVVERLLGDIGGAGDVLIGRVGARADETRGERVGVAVGGDIGGHLRDRPCEVGGVRADDMGFEGVEIDLDDEVVVLLRIGRDLGVGGQEIAVGLGQRRDPRALGGVEIGLHAFVIGEDRGRRPELGAHVGDGGLAGAGDRLGSFAEVLDDAVGAALDGEDVEELENDVLGRRPAVERTREFDADHLGLENLPVETGHDIYRIGAADPARHHPETAGVGGVGVGAEHHPAGEGVVLEHDLVDDARSRASRSRGRNGPMSTGENHRPRG